MLAAFESQPRDQVEAAELDGASALQIFRDITWPCSRAGRRDGGADPRDRGLQDRRPAQRADQWRPGHRDRIADAARLHAVARARSRRARRRSPTRCCSSSTVVCVSLLQLRRAAGAGGHASEPVRATPLGEMAPATKVVVYGLLGLWTLVVLSSRSTGSSVTSLKLPIAGVERAGLPALRRLQPTLHAWRYIFVDIARDTFRPYLNSLIVAIASTCFAMADRLAGGLRAVAHRVPAAARHHRRLRRRHGARRVRSRALRRRLAAGRRGRAGAVRSRCARLAPGALAATLPIATSCSG